MSNKLYILDPTSSDKLGTYRGGGRIIQLLKENLSDNAEFIDSGRARPSLARMTQEDSSTLLIPTWNPFSSPISNQRSAMNNYLMIFDVIPLKYPSHFPIGLKGKFNLWKNKRALNNFDKIITISETSKIDIVQYLQVPAEKIEVIYPCLAKVFLNNKFQKPSSKQISNSKSQNKNIRNTEYSILNTPYCIYVGDVNWNKNLVNLAKAIKLADVDCVFIGKMFSLNTKYSILNTKVHPWLKEYQQFLEEVGDDPRFIFPGYISDDNLVQLYQHTTCNLLLSRDEGFGFSYIEAGSQGCPSILPDIPIFHETTDDNVLFADPNNPEEIASQISKLFNDNKFRNQLGKQTQKHILSKYTPETFRNRFLEILNFEL